MAYHKMALLHKTAMGRLISPGIPWPHILYMSPNFIGIKVERFVNGWRQIEREIDLKIDRYMDWK